VASRRGAARGLREMKNESLGTTSGPSMAWGFLNQGLVTFPMMRGPVPALSRRPSTLPPAKPKPAISKL